MDECSSRRPGRRNAWRRKQCDSGGSVGWDDESLVAPSAPSNAASVSSRGSNGAYQPGRDHRAKRSGVAAPRAPQPRKSAKIGPRLPAASHPRRLRAARRADTSAGSPVTGVRPSPAFVRDHYSLVSRPAPSVPDREQRPAVGRCLCSRGRRGFASSHRSQQWPAGAVVHRVVTTDWNRADASDDQRQSADAHDLAGKIIDPEYVAPTAAARAAVAESGVGRTSARGLRLPKECGPEVRRGDGGGSSSRIRATHQELCLSSGPMPGQRPRTPRHRTNWPAPGERLDGRSVCLPP